LNPNIQKIAKSAAPLWDTIQSSALVAALYGHHLSDREVRNKVLLTMFGPALAEQLLDRGVAFGDVDSYKFCNALSDIAVLDHVLTLTEIVEENTVLDEQSSNKTLSSAGTHFLRAAQTRSWSEQERRASLQVAKALFQPGHPVPADLYSDAPAPVLKKLALSSPEVVAAYETGGQVLATHVPSEDLDIKPEEFIALHAYRRTAEFLKSQSLETLQGKKRGWFSGIKFMWGFYKATRASPDDFDNAVPDDVPDYGVTDNDALYDVAARDVSSDSDDAKQGIRTSYVVAVVIAVVGVAAVLGVVLTRWHRNRALDLLEAEDDGHRYEAFPNMALRQSPV